MYREAWAILAGSLCGVGLLAAAHMLLWPYRHVMKREDAYVVGVACIGAAITLIALLLSEWLIAIAFWAVVIPGGTVIKTARWVRRAMKARGRRRATAARIIQQAEERLSHAVSGERNDQRN